MTTSAEMTEIHKLLAATANFVLALQAHLISDSDTDMIMTAASCAATTMTALVAEVEGNSGEYSEQFEALVRSASFALDAANEEDGTAEMAALCASALRIAHKLIV